MDTLIWFIWTLIAFGAGGQHVSNGAYSDSTGSKQRRLSNGIDLLSNVTEREVDHGDIS